MEYTRSAETVCHSEPFASVSLRAEGVAICAWQPRLLSLRSPRGYAPRDDSGNCHSEGAKRPKNLARSESNEEFGDYSLLLRVTRESSHRITVLGIGNLLLKDEGIGIHVVQKLAGVVSDANVNIIDAGTYPDFLTLVDTSIDKLIVVDAVKADNEPGTIYRLTLDDLDLDSTSPISLHEIGVLDSLKIMALFDRLPESTVIIGIEPKTIDFGLDLSPEIEEKLPEIINLVLKEIEETTAMEVKNDNL
ncbi:MAG: HyaD/HybD family hydrogenase maturation endopeptidase [Chloroflexi bacterium]|nr:HyaD/HybD family hydrogenase maturation endopeptidase [Chloroflexota bacterium]MBL7061975.1 HyaD/HybD family hydrogenase maturation endopeptidase [Dehalococcoidia bacterium]